MVLIKKRSQYLMGVRAGLPVILGFVPVGIAYSIMAGQSGLTVAQTISMSLIVFAGASQMMAVGMYAQGAGLAAIIVATFILNLRHLIMSTCVMNRMKPAKTGIKLLAAFGVTDEGFAIYTTTDEDKCTVWYFLGLVTVTYCSWFAGTAVGAVASSLLPPIVAASLGIALYAMFIGLLIPGVKTNLRLGALVIVTALFNWVLSAFLASSWSIIVSTLVGAAVGAFVIKDENERGEDVS